MTQSIRPGSWRAWVLASRPPTLVAAVVPVAAGSAVAFVEGGFRWEAAILAFLGALWIQIGTNFANDVFDFEAGTDDENRLGPTRAAQAGLLTPAQMRRGMWCAFGLATLCGLGLFHLAGWPMLVIGILSIASGIAYTGGPYPLGYNGLGDVFVLAFFGFVAVCGTTWAHLVRVPELAWWVSVPVGALATAILVVNNVRDRDGDQRSGKRTLVVRWGRVGGEREMQLLLLVSFVVPVLVWSRGLTGAAVLLPWILAPEALRLERALVREEGLALNRVLVGTARLQLLFGFLLVAGLVLGR